MLTLAQQEAIRFNHNCVGTEHLLLGLMLEGANIAAGVLSDVGVELSDARDAVAQIIDGHNERVAGREISFAPRATKTIALANDEAFRLGHDYVAPEHLLLALLREGTQGIVGGVLIALGMDPEHVRACTMEAVTTT